MAPKLQVLSILAATLLAASPALAASGAAGIPPAAAGAVDQAAVMLSPAAPACPGPGLPAFFPEPQPTATDLCGGCSDAICAGKPVGSACGDGFRCIATIACVSSAYRCQCKII